MKKIVVFLAFSEAVALSALQAATTFTGTYTFGSGGNVSSFAYNGTAIPNVTVGNLLKVGVNTSSGAGNFRASLWALDPITVGDLDGSIDSSKYYEFSLTAASGYTLDMTSFTFGVGRSGTGTRSFQWRSSLDNYATAFSNYTTLAAGLSNTSGALSYTADSTTSQTGNVLNLSSLTGLSGVTFRFYGYNSEATGGTGGLDGNFTFAGALNAPVSASYTWTGSGSGGTWQNGQSGNLGTTYNNAADSTVTFSGTGEAVSVSGNVQAGGLVFSAGGFSLTSGSVALGQGTVATSAGTTVIDSVLDGTAGLIKSGVGTLVANGANTFTGNVTVSEGTLQIGSDGALGAAANDVVNSGTVKTTANIALGAGRDISGSGTLDIAGGTTLTVNGGMNATATTLANSGTLDLQGATRSVGNLTVNAAGTVNGAGAINASGLTASGLSSGTASINTGIVFTTGDKTLNVASGGTLDLNGALSNGGGTGRIAKTGAGTLIVSGENAMGGLRVGAAAATMTDGGKVILESSVVGSQAQAIQHNFGTLEASTALTISNGISFGGRTTGAATLAGGDMEFQGQSAFFRGTGTTGQFALNVNNTTTLSGGLGATSGSGSATGVTLGGTGTMKISGNSSTFTDTITTADTVKLVVNSTLGAGVSVGNGSLLGGSGSVGALTVTTGGTLTPGNSPGLLAAASATFQSGSILNWEIYNAIGTAGVEWDLLSVTGDLNISALNSSSMNLVLNSLSALPNTVGALAGYDAATPYSWVFARAATITGVGVGDGLDVSSLFNINTSNFNNGAGPGQGWKVVTGSVTVGADTFRTLELQAVPEPSTHLLLALGAAGLIGMRALGRKQS